MAAGGSTPDGGTIVAEVFAGAHGVLVAADDPELATIEVTVRYPDGSEQRTYLARSS